MIVKDRNDNSLLKECFFEQVADNSDKYKCKICFAGWCIEQHLIMQAQCWVYQLHKSFKWEA